jgi:hypothetical protein
MFSALAPQALSLPISETVKDEIRARILRNMLLSITQRS